MSRPVRLVRPIQKSLLPRQRFRSRLHRTQLPILLSQFLPSLDISLVNEVPVQTQTQLEWQVDHSQWSLRKVQGIENQDIVTQNV
jgi:hypothetical protein